MKYAVDAGVIKCICGFDDDDGFTIQCESCNVWQHAVCVGIESEAEVPDIYLCDQCGPRELDVKAAREKQKARLQALKQIQEKKRRKESEEREGGSSTGETSATTLASQTPSIVPSRESTEQPNNEEDYHFDYTVIPRNTVDPGVKDYLVKLANEEIMDKDISYMSLSEYSKIVKPKITLKLFQDSPKAKFCGFSKHGLVANQPIQKDRFIIEYVGHVSHKDQYKADPINQYQIHAVPKASVLFHPTLPLVVDGRLVGNDARFIRRSCHPNCKVATVVVNNEDIIFVVFATEPIKPGSELTLAWEWDPHHPVQKLLHGYGIDQLSPQEKLCLGSMVETILQRTECSDPTNSDCIIQKMKKCVSANPRSARGSKTRALNLLKETNGEGGSSYDESSKSSSASPIPEALPDCNNLSIGFGIGSSYKGYGGYGGIQFPSPVPPTCIDFLDKLDDGHRTIAMDYIETFAYVDPPYYEQVEEPVAVSKTPKSFSSPSHKRKEAPERDDQICQETQTIPIDKRLRASSPVEFTITSAQNGSPVEPPIARTLPFKANLYRLYHIRAANPDTGATSPVLTTPLKRLSMKEYFHDTSGVPPKEVKLKVEDPSESLVEERRHSSAKKGKLSFADYMKQKKKAS